MSGDLIAQQGQVPAPNLIDNRRTNLITGIENLSRAFPQIPQYEDHETWTEYRDTHWIPLLRQLDHLCRLAADLHPNHNITGNNGHYPKLTSLIHDEHCDSSFYRQMISVSTYFLTTGTTLTQIPDSPVRTGFRRLNENFEKAFQRFSQEIRQTSSNRPSM